ncbi:MAG: HAMP domain-containing histidine kinase, partial [Campylobacteraceae bacterium]|nr:HAMP domain-containing histidine kinase [Campylobacteraceae bacterium]
LFDKIIHYTRHYEVYEIDEILLLFFISGFIALFYSLRRYKEMSVLQNKLKNLSSKLEHDLENEIKKSNKTLKNINNDLDKRIKEAVVKSLEQDKLVNQQNKMALMGEMIESIAHQWRQPLSSITVCASSLKLEKELNILDDKSFSSSLDSIMNSSKYLSETINDFKNFYSNDKIRKLFSLSDCINDSLKLLAVRINEYNIEVILNLEKIDLFAYKNELMHIFINIINNAIVELEDKDCKRIIFFESFEDKDNLYIKIKDNAGGVKEDIKNKIFDSHVTSKEEKGTGIGLYMCKNILENSFSGKINVNNISFSFENVEYKGAEFKVSLKKSINN